MKIGYLAAILKRYNILEFFFFFAELWFFIARTYMVQISLQNSGGKVVFSGGSTPPWAPTGVKVPWSLLSDQGTFTPLTLKSVNLL